VRHGGSARAIDDVREGDRVTPAGTSFPSWWSPSNTSIHALLRAAVGQLWGLSHSARARDPGLTHRRRQVARAQARARALAAGTCRRCAVVGSAARPHAISDQRGCRGGSSAA
jgi:hypothetical protein